MKETVRLLVDGRLRALKPCLGRLGMLLEEYSIGRRSVLYLLMPAPRNQDGLQSKIRVPRWVEGGVHRRHMRWHAGGACETGGTVTSGCPDFRAIFLEHF